MFSVNIGTFVSAILRFGDSSGFGCGEGARLGVLGVFTLFGVLVRLGLGAGSSSLISAGSGDATA